MARKPAPKITDEAKKLVESADDALSSELGDLHIRADGPSDLGSQDIDAWVQSTGWTPVEFLTHTYRNGFQRMEHRIAAAKAVLDYAHRKLPQKLEVEANGTVGVRSIDAAALSKLSGKELETLEKILEKMGSDA